MSRVKELDSMAGPVYATPLQLREQNSLASEWAPPASQCLAQNYCRTGQRHYPHQTREPLDPVHPLMPPLRNSAGKSRNCQRVWMCSAPAVTSPWRTGSASDVAP